MQAYLGYTVITDCLMVHRIVRLNLNKLEKDYSSIVTVCKSKVKISNDV